MVVDAKTGRTLHAENEDALRHPASVTKVMTLYLLFEQLERGRISLATPLRVSANAAAQAPVQARPRGRRDDRGRGRHPGAGDEVGQRRRGGRRRESRRLGGGLRGRDDPQGARPRHEPDGLPQRLGPARSRAAHDGARPHDAGARHPGPLPALLPLLPDPGLQLRRQLLPQPQQAPRPRRGRRRHQDRLHPRLRLQPDDQRQDGRPPHRRRGARRALGFQPRPGHGGPRRRQPAARLCRRPSGADGRRGSARACSLPSSPSRRPHRRRRDPT